ncbi:hypothetical protein CCACVL1_09900 [Corchorus capsularis]|uniref:DUF4378 domain-containing protein n=1 Tax=Corchorus capsularis TaxID=210143 RepID=A0A1R3ITR2_COCAP|nr:hypothetical protein CCACVL1_09900 [Corchorus capsularis]
MGRDWYWGSGAKTSSSRKAAAAAAAAERDQSTAGAPSGCISAVFQLFDFHHFQFPLNHSTGSSSSCGCFKPDSFYSPNPTPTAVTTTTLKGTEAPRNSLESEEEGSTTSTSVSVSLTSTSKEDENLNIPVGIQIKTRGSKVDTSSEISNSPGTKTPTLVARLMGLDLLPESRSPSFSSSSASKSQQLKHHLHMQYSPKPNFFQGKTTTPHRHSIDGDQIRPGTRSSPETPRISSGRRSDVDYHHRFSLQINKENMNAAGEDLVMSRLSSLKRKELIKHEDENNRSPGHYARQIMKQVKESVSRKVGMDITNTVRNREQAREELVNQFKYKKISKALAKVNGNDSNSNSSPGKLHSSTPSCSPRLRFMESKNTNPPNPPKPEMINIQPPQPIRVSSPKPKLQAVQEEQEQQQPPPRGAAAASKCKKFSSSIKKPQQKQEEPFVRPSTANRVNIPDKKCRKTPLSNDLVNNIKIPQKQVLLDAAQGPKRRSSQLSSCSSQTYNKQEATHGHVSQDKPNIIGDRCNDAAVSSSAAAATTTTGDELAEYYEYISRILRRTGLELDKDTPVSFISWFSPSHPLDPSIFYFIEHLTNFSANYYKTTKSKSSLRHRCNRKLLFHLVDEILVEILKPHFNLKPWVITHDYYYQVGHMNGSRLIDTLCSKIRSFPQADCLVLEDIDALIDKDLPEMKLQSCLEAYEEEGEGIVTEIEKDILEALVHETAVDYFAMR